MKKHFPLILCLSALALLLVGCDRNEKQARKVGYNYAYAMANYRVQEAAQYATEETKNTTLVIAQRLTDAVGEEYIKSDTPAKVEIVKVNRIDDTTTVIDFIKNTPIKKDVKFSSLIRKRNGRWLVHDTIPTHNDTEMTGTMEPSVKKNISVSKK